MLGLKYVPTGHRVPAGRLDLLGLALAAAGVTALTYGITETAQRHTVTQPIVLSCLLGGIGALVAFVHRSLRVATPLLDLRVFSDRVFAAATGQTFFSGAALFGGQIIMPLYFQLQRDQSIVATGLLLLPFGLGAAATFPVAGHLTDRFGGGRVAAAGLTLTTIATIPMAQLGGHADLVLVETLQVLRGGPRPSTPTTATSSSPPSTTTPPPASSRTRSTTSTSNGTTRPPVSSPTASPAEPAPSNTSA